MSTGFEKNDRSRIDKGWDIVKRNVDRIRSMISDILYYTKDRELEYETVDIFQFMTDISSMMENKANNFKVNFKYNFESDLGEFTVDATAIRTALVNILENSFDACRKDLSKPSHYVDFNVKADEDRKVIVINVIDDGIGMDRETREKIFSLFFSSKGPEGTGLGLFIANQIIKKHSGSIDVSAQPGEGVHFQIIIPKNPEVDIPDPDGNA